MHSCGIALCALAPKPVMGGVPITEAPCPDHLFHISLLSRCTAMLAGLRTLIQTRHGPDRYVPSIFFDIDALSRLGTYSASACVWA